jgi:general secretion pathway protein A
MLWQSFGLQGDPFGATPNPRQLYPSRTHQEALASLRYGFRSNRGFTAMIAQPGMGKTTLLFRFLDEIRDAARSVFLFDMDSSCEPRELLGYILLDLGITPAGNTYQMHQQLNDALVEENRRGRTVVVVIDEAQNLSEAMLERVRLLTNFETSKGKLMQVVLAGQPQLADKLMQPSLVQLRQRISTICRLEPFSEEETLAYISYRLRQAGHSGDPLFSADALALIAEASQGIPRTINNLCFNALSLCRALKRNAVDRSMVSEIIADLQLTPLPVGQTVGISEPEAVKLHGPTERDLAGEYFDSNVVPVQSWLTLLALGAFGLAKLFPTTPKNSTKTAPVRPAPRPIPIRNNAAFPARERKLP